MKLVYIFASKLKSDIIIPSQKAAHTHAQFIPILIPFDTSAQICGRTSLPIMSFFFQKTEEKSRRFSVSKSIKARGDRSEYIKRQSKSNKYSKQVHKTLCNRSLNPKSRVIQIIFARSELLRSIICRCFLIMFFVLKESYQ